MVLQGGVANRGLVVRVGPHVLRPSNPHSQSVFAFLRHVRHARASRACPGRWALTPTGASGSSSSKATRRPPHYRSGPSLTTRLASVAALIARFHGAAAGFDGHQAGVELERRDGRSPGRADHVPQRHLSGERRVPGRRSRRPARLRLRARPADRCTTWRVRPDVRADRRRADRGAAGLGPAPTSRRASASCATATGSTGPGRDDLLEILDDAMAHSGEFVKRRAELGEPGFVMMWEWMGGQERWDRRRRWWAEDRPTFVGALS